MLAVGLCHLGLQSWHHFDVFNFSTASENSITRSVVVMTPRFWYFPSRTAVGIPTMHPFLSTASPPELPASTLAEVNMTPSDDKLLTIPSVTVRSKPPLVCG